MLWKGFQRPKRLEFERETLTDRFGRFYAQPFERGFGTTIGNAMRRVLLSSIEGAAVTAVKIDGVLHEFSPIPGVVEDATDIILNLKQVPLKMHSDATKTLYLNITKAGEVRARDIQTDADVEILEPDAHIATVAEGGKLRDGDAREARPRLRLGRQELRRGPRHRLDPDRLGALADQEGQLPRRGGAHRPEHRLRQADDRRVDQRLGDAARRVSLSAKLIRDHLNIFINLEDVGDLQLEAAATSRARRRTRTSTRASRSWSCRSAPTTA